MFAEKGFRAASLADVADRAGYTIGAVYSNFANKDALFHGLMSERLRMAEEGLAAGIRADQSDPDASTGPPEDRMERVLDQMAAAEDAVPPGWWRLLYEYRAYVASDPVARAELSKSDRRCREIIARSIEHFATTFGVVLSMPAIQAAELSMALVDGLRAAHAEGRSTLTAGQGLRLVVKSLVMTSDRIDPA